MGETYIIRFESGRDRDKFVPVVRARDLRYELGEFLPDLIVFDLGRETLQELKRRAPTAKFFEDFQHQPM